MASFCKFCGSPLESGFRFCDSCGRPVSPAIWATPGTPSVGTGIARRPVWPGKKAVKIVGSVLGVLCVGALAAYFLTRPAALPKAGALTTMLMAVPGVADIGCVDDFEYAKSPVYVRNYDNQTRRYLDYLVNAGVYAGPRVRMERSGFIAVKRYEYTHAAGAEKYIRHGKLCMADGISVSHVDYGERANAYRYLVVPAHIVYHLKSPAAWATAPTSGRVSGRLPLKTQGEINVPLKYENRHWSVMSGEEGAAFAKSTAAHSPDVEIFWDRFSDLFRRDPGAPIYGSWVTANGVFPMQLTLAKGSLDIVGIRSDKVQYHKEGDQIVITQEDGTSETLRVTVISRNEIAIDMGKGKPALHLQRIK